jgi:rubredoxin
MTTQELRDLVGWAGAAGAEYLTAGDRQDWLLEGTSTGRLPERLSVRPAGSLQSTAYGNPPSPSHPWLTTGVWMDLLTQITVPDELDVQLLHEGTRAHFIRWGHVRLTAQRAPHRWAVALRRPGSVRLTVPETAVVETGAIPALVQAAGAAWNRDENFWRGTPLSETPPETMFPREGFHDETSGTFAFGLWTPSRFRVEHLRDVAWLAWESGAPRVWLTPDRVLLIQGLPQRRKKEWEEWLARARLPSRHGDVARSVRAAGAPGGHREVADKLHADDRLPPGGAVTVADDALNRGDGVCGPFATLIRSSEWLFRSADGHRSGEGTLDEVFQALDKPSAGIGAAPEPVPDTGARRCGSCLTVYEPAVGDPRAEIPPQTAFETLPAGWECPVCGGPGTDFLPLGPT